MTMTKAQVRWAVGVLALVVVGGGAFAFFVKQSDGRREGDDHPSDPANASSGVPSGQPRQEIQAVAPEQPAAAPEPRAPLKLGAIRVADAREYFTRSGHRFEDQPLPGNVARSIGTSQDRQTVLELVGLAALEQATLRYTLRAGALNGGDMAAIMYLMQHMQAEEADVRWAIDAARKGEPTTRTIGAVAYAIQRGPSDTKEFVMRPAPGFE
jgi:hypothetical protein